MAAEARGTQDMASHLTLLGWLHVVFGALAFLGGVLIIVVVSGVGLFVAEQERGNASGVGHFVAMFGWLIGGLLIVTSLPGIVGGLGLLQRRNWARILVLIVSGFQLFSFPLGTLLGVFGFWVLLHRDTLPLFAGDLGYGAESRY